MKNNLIYLIYVFMFQERKVIRFRKCNAGEASPDGGFSRVNRERDFIRFVLSPFLQPYLNIPEILRYDRTELAKFSETIRSLRPGKKNQLDELKILFLRKIDI